MERENKQLIIAGAGPAGVSAALYAARSGVTPLVLHKGGGALEKANSIENYYGLAKPVSGKELYLNGISQIEALGWLFPMTVNTQFKLQNTPIILKH